MSHKVRRKHVVPAYPVSVPWMALVFRGMTDYAREHGGWNFTTSPPTLSGMGRAVCPLTYHNWPAQAPQLLYSRRSSP
jgi:hypothetical protein